MSASLHPGMTPAPKAALGRTEFVALVAFVMALNSAAIDVFIPGLRDIAQEFGVESNARQLVITTYVVGFGAAQLIYGPLADRFGRRPILLVGLAIYLAGAVASIFAPSFGALLALRFVQGIGAAATRVVATALVRDRFSGAPMANVMSLIMMVFMIMPVLAPNLGALVLLFADWHGLGAVMAAIGLIALVWAGLRLPETLTPEKRRPLSGAKLKEAFSIVATNRIAAFYTLAQAAFFGVLLAFVNMAEQIFTETYDLGRAFTLIFAVMAGFMALSSFANSRLVERLGTRRLSHTALLAYLIIVAIHLVLAVIYGGVTPFWMFLILFSASLCCFGFVPPNFNAIAMEPMGHVAGVASAVLGASQMVVGGALGAIIAAFYDGSLYALLAGSVGLAVVSLGMAAIAERGRLFGT